MLAIHYVDIFTVSGCLFNAFNQASKTRLMSSKEEARGAVQQMAIQNLSEGTLNALQPVTSHLTRQLLELQ